VQPSEIREIKSSIPSLEGGTKLKAEQKLALWDQIRSDPTVPSSTVLEHYFSIDITIRHLNRLRLEWDLSRPKGRPRKLGAERQSELLPVPVRLEPNVSFIGVHIFSCWVEMQETFPMILNLMKQAIEIHMENNPADSFPLLNHRDDTLLCRFKALINS